MYLIVLLNFDLAQMFQLACKGSIQLFESYSFSCKYHFAIIPFLSQSGPSHPSTYFSSTLLYKQKYFKVLLHLTCARSFQLACEGHCMLYDSTYTICKTRTYISVKVILLLISIRFVYKY